MIRRLLARQSFQQTFWRRHLAGKPVFRDELDRQLALVLADYVAAIAVCGGLTRGRPESEAGAAIAKPFPMLFSPGESWYLPVENPLPILGAPLPSSLWLASFSHLLRARGAGTLCCGRAVRRAVAQPRCWR